MIETIEDRIRERAHLIWEREGRPEGREFAHWEQAAAELAAESASPAETPAPKKRAPRKAAAPAAEGEAAPAKKPRAPAKPRVKKDA